MTEGEKAYFQRRIKDEMNLARAIDCQQRKALHLQWAQYFNDRLDGKRGEQPPPLTSHYASIWNYRGQATPNASAGKAIIASAPPSILRRSAPASGAKRSAK
jgi:hypothetical protein